MRESLLATPFGMPWTFSNGHPSNLCKRKSRDPELVRNIELVVISVANLSSDYDFPSHFCAKLVEISQISKHPREQTLTLGQLKQQTEKRKSLSISVIIRTWLTSVRVSYKIVVAVVFWATLVLVLYSLRVLGFIDAR